MTKTKTERRATARHVARYATRGASKAHLRDIGNAIQRRADAARQTARKGTE